MPLALVCHPMVRGLGIDRRAPLRDRFFKGIVAEGNIIREEVGSVIRRASRKAQLFRNDVQDRAFSAAVVAVKYRYVGKVKLGKVAVSEKAKRVFGIIARP